MARLVRHRASATTVNSLKHFWSLCFRYEGTEPLIVLSKKEKKKKASHCNYIYSQRNPIYSERVPLTNLNSA